MRQCRRTLRPVRARYAFGASSGSRGVQHDGGITFRCQRRWGEGTSFQQGIERRGHAFRDTDPNAVQPRRTDSAGNCRLRNSFVNHDLGVGIL